MHGIVGNCRRLLKVVIMSRRLQHRAKHWSQLDAFVILSGCYDKNTCNSSPPTAKTVRATYLLSASLAYRHHNPINLDWGLWSPHCAQLPIRKQVKKKERSDEGKLPYQNKIPLAIFFHKRVQTQVHKTPRTDYPGGINILVKKIRCLCMALAHAYHTDRRGDYF